MAVKVLVEQQTQTVLAVDTVSTSNGGGDGFMTCGPRTYSIMPADLGYLVLIGDVLALESNDMA